MSQTERKEKHAEITQEHGKFWLQIRHNLLNGTKAQVLQLLADHDAEVERKARESEAAWWHARLLIVMEGRLEGLARG